MKWTLPAIALLLLTACSGDTDSKAALGSEKRIDNIVRISKIEEGRYDFYVLNPVTKVVEEKYVIISKEHRRFVADVAPGQPAWLLIKRETNGRITLAEFHIPEVDLSRLLFK